MEQLVTMRPRERAAQDTPKSRRTRTRILDSAMRLIAEVGYVEATNARIAEMSGITRGAMLYHFPGREDLVAAVVAHIQAQRMLRMREIGAQRPPGADPAEHAIDAYWALLSEVPFVAFAELEAVARADEMVRERLSAAQDQFDHADMGDQPVVQGAAAARLQTSRDLARYLLEGLHRARLTYDEQGRTERLLSVIKRATHMLNHRGADSELWRD